MASETARSTDALVDTSVALPFVLTDHDWHQRASAALTGRRLGLAGHAAFETFSAITRMPSVYRRSPSATAVLLADNFPYTEFLSERAAASLLARLGELGIAGGAVYDALVAAVAVEHQLPLVTRDRRAVGTYRAVGADVELLA